MQLSTKNRKLFFKLHSNLLNYAHTDGNAKRILSLAEFNEKFDIKQKDKMRKKLYAKPFFLDKFIKENPLSFNKKELKIIKSWKNFLKGEFVMLRQLKNYAIFLDFKKPRHAYGVLALNNLFEEILPWYPIIIEAVLLPFKNKIIYDGIFYTQQISFGPGTRRNFNDSYQEAKARFGIITSLPFSEKKFKKKPAELLKAYLKIKSAREYHWDKIIKMISRDKNLRVLFHQEMGKIDARSYRKRLHEIKIKPGWFAILNGLLIAGSDDKNNLESIIAKIVPKEKKDYVYKFKLNEY